MFKHLKSTNDRKPEAKDPAHGPIALGDAELKSVVGSRNGGEGNDLLIGGDGVDVLRAAAAPASRQSAS